MTSCALLVRSNETIGLAAADIVISEWIPIAMLELNAT